MAGFSDYGEYDGLGLAELVRRGEVTPGELVEEAISRIEKLNPHLNAVIHKMYDLARKAAEGELPDGPFKGVPFLLKDMGAAYAGVPMRCGSRFLNDYVPDYDSELVKRYKAAGVIVVGKTNLPELALSTVTEPELFGPTNNPWDLTRTPGGSSGGAAAAVSARIVPLAHGSDGGGSIRIPSSCCGLFGLKPTRGRNPAGPDLGQAWHGLLVEHVLTRTVRDSAAMLDATAGPDVGAPYYAPPPSRPFLDEVGTEPGRLRIAFTSGPVGASAAHGDCLQGLETTAQLCRELGHELIEATPDVDMWDALVKMVDGEILADVKEAESRLGRTAAPSDFDPNTWEAISRARQLTAAEFCIAVRTVHRCARQIGQFFGGYDVLLTPTLGMPPVTTGWQGAKNYLLFTPWANVTGQPAMSVPLHWNDEGLPIGMQLLGRYADEATLFRLAGQLERARPWADRIPPLCG